MLFLVSSIRVRIKLVQSSSLNGTYKSTVVNEKYLFKDE